MQRRIKEKVGVLQFHSLDFPARVNCQQENKTKIMGPETLNYIAQGLRKLRSMKTRVLCDWTAACSPFTWPRGHSGLGLCTVAASP